ncbi:hypothetical protein N7505_000283 [Penicillium chrysogenum]|uniref:Uncharacterized protein n=1 Tax=Penicillium chrysogenum TaxID=5076 RepID=A0ABQ8WTL1_PENCH|nr:hypothetical protein N7505_000283 [Penicillium chrysogenum]
MKTTKLLDGHGSLYKEVRFSPTETPIRRTKSVSATFPPVISGYGRTAFQDSARVNSFAMDTSYIDQSRALLQSQRLNFETERELFAQERQLWEKERALLRSKIAELEDAESPGADRKTRQHAGWHHAQVHGAATGRGSSCDHSALPVAPGNPPDTAPSTAARPIEHRNSLKLKLSELGPPNENLLRHAGHTPMAIIDVDDSRRSTQEGTPLEVASQVEETPFAPVATNVHQPSENEISYFPDVPDDPALQGPLGLINDEEHDSNFLNELDQKLLDQAKNILGSGESTDPNETDPESEFPREEEEPEIKFKKSTNFGTAFGISNSSHV